MTSGSTAPRYCPTYSASLLAGNVTACGSAPPVCDQAIPVESNRTPDNIPIDQVKRLIEPSS